jgi:hypothetical protein
MRCSMPCLLLVFSLAACTSRARAPEVRIETAPVAVAIGCAVDRPSPVAPLNSRIAPPGWAQLAPGAKARAVQAQAGRRMNHADALDAATSACPAAPAR